MNSRSLRRNSSDSEDVSVVRGAWAPGPRRPAALRRSRETRRGVALACASCPTIIYHLCTPHKTLSHLFRRGWAARGGAGHRSGSVTERVNDRRTASGKGGARRYGDCFGDDVKGEDARYIFSFFLCCNPPLHGAGVRQREEAERVSGRPSEGEQQARRQERGGWGRRRLGLAGGRQAWQTKQRASTTDIGPEIEVAKAVVPRARGTTSSSARRRVQRV